MTDLDNLHHFLGTSITSFSDGLFLSQREYTTDLQQRACMAECHSTSNHIDTQAKLSASGGAPAADPRNTRASPELSNIEKVYITTTPPEVLEFVYSTP